MPGWVETIRRAWSFGAGPGGTAMTIDMDLTICGVHGKTKQGAAFGYTRVLGYHPLLDTWAATGEILHARLRKGSSQRGTGRFVEELIARVRHCGATGPLVLRSDAGFFSFAPIDTLTRLGVSWSITVNIGTHVRACIETIDESVWQTIHYPDGKGAQVAETTYVTGVRWGNARSLRLVVRRTRLVESAQATLWPDWRYHAFVTDLELPLIEADQFHCDHARVELAIRDLKEGAGLEHCPSGKFFADAAWLACAVLARDFIRWTDQIGHIVPDGQLSVTRTVRSRLVVVPGRSVNSSGPLVLRLPEKWPWAKSLTEALKHMRSLPQLV